MIPGARLVILGRQGAGKGTQCVRLSRHYVVPHISTGDMLRAAVREETELGKMAKEVMDSGGLVGDDIMIGLVAERLQRADAETRGFILDGFPRTMPQAEALDAMLREIGRELHVVFELQVSAEACSERLLRRAVQEGRTDDTPEAIRTRLSRYYEETEPLIEYYRTSTGNLVGIHADRTINAVFAEVQRALEQAAVR